MAPHRAVPFLARWTSGAQSAGTLEARLVLDDRAVFEGHYPGNPIFAGSFLVEALFQAAASALGGEWRLAELVTCRFRAPLRPGDVIEARFVFLQLDTGLTQVEAKAVGRGDAGEATLLLARRATTPELRAEPARADLPAEPAAGSSRVLDADFVRLTLPHRAPMLLVDRAVVVGPESAKPSLVAYKAVTLDEPCYATPAGPIAGAWPESLVVESFCQACGLLRAGSAPVGQVRDTSRVPVIARLAKLRFVGEVRCGEVLEHRVRMSARTSDGAIFAGESVAGGRTVLQVDRVVAAMAPLDPGAAAGAPPQ